MISWLVAIARTHLPPSVVIKTLDAPRIRRAAESVMRESSSSSFRAPARAFISVRMPRARVFEPRASPHAHGTRESPRWVPLLVGSTDANSRMALTQLLLDKHAWALSGKSQRDATAEIRALAGEADPEGARASWARQRLHHMAVMISSCHAAASWPSHGTC